MINLIVEGPKRYFKRFRCLKRFRLYNRIFGSGKDFSRRNMVESRTLQKSHPGNCKVRDSKGEMQGRPSKSQDAEVPSS